MGLQRHPGEPLAQGGELRMLCPQPGGPQAPCHSNTRPATNPIVFIQGQIQLPLPCCWVQHGHPPPHSSLQPLCRCPLRENQKHEYLKPGDKADTECIQAHPSPAPSNVQEGTRSFCGSQHHATHVPAVSSCCWLAGLCRGEQRCRDDTAARSFLEYRDMQSFESTDLAWRAGGRKRRMARSRIQSPTSCSSDGHCPRSRKSEWPLVCRSSQSFHAEKAPSSSFSSAFLGGFTP
ncbi:cyclin-dependent kinases regulatory subunit 1 isoform X1 [Corvus hawaiiensis]|uniref:cyclin-dependent kinases regulatory subunit 1 isoform X1 n=1 Tax=Corvus moneduloides TaxID=1196302 RepID=UPI001362878D|nr:cyclin-dependent kinases regulatory subunit 1 isoform X1 [Corvus moneduloides]XP_041890423.1 cyclin-dependent kinases regulatory subunit 1 isoform X1 [Corvus kubaryi]XP_048144658.1 cyclin-dependent kinases regulatory subunit 1 isoform X1 [Corvus hawaiiensis]